MIQEEARGVVQLRCRMCGNLIEHEAADTPRRESYTFPDGTYTNRWGHLPRGPLVELHRHADGSIGVADLIGVRPIGNPTEGP